jgi:hypothetical protein
MFSYFAICIENLKPIQSIARSWQLTNLKPNIGVWITAKTFITALVFSIPSIILNLIGSGLGQIIVKLITFTNVFSNVLKTLIMGVVSVPNIIFSLFIYFFMAQIYLQLKAKQQALSQVQTGQIQS